MSSTAAAVVIAAVFLATAAAAYPASPAAQPALTNAVEVLSSSGFVSMALALQLTTQTLALNSPFLTVFSPSDDLFQSAALPPLSSFRSHFSPSHLSAAQLRSLSVGSRVPTLLPNASLLVTAAGAAFSLNGVSIDTSALYDDGSLAIYRAAGVFDPSFKLRPPNPNLDCSAGSTFEDDPNPFGQAARVLKTRGFAAAAALLDAQLLQPARGRDKITVFAPADGAVLARPPVPVTSLAEYMALLSRHVVPCRLAWSDLMQLEEGTLLQTYQEGFLLRVTQINGVFAVNGVPVVMPDLYYSSTVVVHGVGQTVPPPEVGRDRLNSTTFGDYEDAE